MLFPPSIKEKEIKCNIGQINATRHSSLSDGEGNDTVREAAFEVGAHLFVYLLKKEDVNCMSTWCHDIHITAFSLQNNQVKQFLSPPF